jgi:hypothetical protein
MTDAKRVLNEALAALHKVKATPEAYSRLYDDDRARIDQVVAALATAERHA